MLDQIMPGFSVFGSALCLICSAVPLTFCQGDMDTSNWRGHVHDVSVAQTMSNVNLYEGRHLPYVIGRCPLPTSPFLPACGGTDLGSPVIVKQTN